MKHYGVALECKFLATLTTKEVNTNHNALLSVNMLKTDHMTQLVNEDGANVELVCLRGVVLLIGEQLPHLSTIY